MHLVVSSTNFLIYFYSNPTFRRTFIGFLKPGDDGPSFGSDANSGPGFRSKANSVAGELISKSSLAKTVVPCPTTSLMAKHQVPKTKAVETKRGQEENLLFFCQICAYHVCFTPSCTATYLFLWKKINCVAPPWGTWLRSHFWGKESKEKSPTAGGNRTHNLENFAKLACVLPLCYNRCTIGKTYSAQYDYLPHQVHVKTSTSTSPCFPYLLNAFAPGRLRRLETWECRNLLSLSQPGKCRKVPIATRDENPASVSSNLMAEAGPPQPGTKDSLLPTLSGTI